MQVSITGITGNMGQAVLEEVLKIDEIDKLKLLVLPEDKRINDIVKKYKKYPEKFKKFDIVFGNLKDARTCNFLVADSDYVVNLAAVIPPHSDKFPMKAIECNEIGVNNLVSSIERMEKQPKFIHISTVALYGNRNSKHIWGQVGDPLLVSPFDIYSATKLRGEFRVLESGIKNWAVLRQSAMLHKNMMSDNISDGLMFHTCFNAPLEWVTAHDSGVLIANILKSDLKEDLKDKFWKKCFNIGGGDYNRLTGFDTLNDGFKMIGGGAKNFFKPNYNATRNFHGVWFYDGHKLNDLFSYQQQDTAVYWAEILKTHSYYKMGRIVPKAVIRKFVIKRLFKDDNSPAYWFKHNDQARLQAYFGGKGKYLAITDDWKNFPLLVENKDEEGKDLNYLELKNIKNAKLIDYGFDREKQITLKDLQNVAKLHGGKLISKKFDGLYAKHEWETQDGEIFKATPFTVLIAGHWYNPIYKEYVWDFDRLSKKDKIFSQIWLDSHSEKENFTYYFDEKFNARMKVK